MKSGWVGKPKLVGSRFELLNTAQLMGVETSLNYFFSNYVFLLDNYFLIQPDIFSTVRNENFSGIVLFSKVNQNNEQLSSFFKNDSRIDWQVWTVECFLLCFFSEGSQVSVQRERKKRELVEKDQEHLELNRGTWWRVGARAAPLEFTLSRFIRKIMFHFDCHKKSFCTGNNPSSIASAHTKHILPFTLQLLHH
jgi:hypothetical protein